MLWNGECKAVFCSELYVSEQLFARKIGVCKNWRTRVNGLIDCVSLFYSRKRGESEGEWGLPTHFFGLKVSEKCQQCCHGTMRLCSRHEHHSVTSNSYSTYNTPRHHAHRPNSDARPFGRQFQSDHHSSVQPFNSASQRFVLCVLNWLQHRSSYRWQGDWLLEYTVL